MKKILIIGICLTIGTVYGTVLACEGTSVTTTCYDAESWGSGSLYARVCDNEKCGRSFFDLYDNQGSCTYCNEPPEIGG
jgi:hypothetical protein